MPGLPVTGDATAKGSWNDGPGDSRKYRNRAALSEKFDETPDGCWVWLGPVNFAGVPSYRMPGGQFQAAHLVVQEVFRGKRYATMEKTCQTPLCVRHWQLPVPKKPAPAPRPPRTPPARVPKPKLDGMPAQRKTHCIRGHELFLTRKLTPGGKTYCTACHTEAMKERNIKRKAETAARRKAQGLAPYGEPVGTAVASAGRPLKTHCIRGHDLALTRKREKSSGRLYCAACVKARKEEKARNE